MGKRHKDRLPGGMADKSKPGDFDPEQLRMGIEVEMEHTNDRRLAREIAMDHLKEDPRYYTKLKRVHKEGLDMNISNTVAWLSALSESLNEMGFALEEAMKLVKATGRDPGYLPGVSQKSEKGKHFRSFPEKTADTYKKKREQEKAKAMTRGGQEVKPMAQSHGAMEPAKKKGFIARAVSKLRGESLADIVGNVRYFMEAAAPPPIKAKARAALGRKPLPTRGGSQPPKMKMKKVDPNSDVGKELANIKRMNRSDTEKALDDIRALNKPKTDNKPKTESIISEIRAILEAERYGGGSKLNPRERAAKGLSKVNQLRRMAPPTSKGASKGLKKKDPIAGLPRRVRG